MIQKIGYSSLLVLDGPAKSAVCLVFVRDNCLALQPSINSLTCTDRVRSLICFPCSSNPLYHWQQLNTLQHLKYHLIRHEFLEVFFVLDYFNSLRCKRSFSYPPNLKSKRTCFFSNILDRLNAETKSLNVQFFHYLTRKCISERDQILILAVVGG